MGSPVEKVVCGLPEAPKGRTSVILTGASATKASARPLGQALSAALRPAGRRWRRALVLGDHVRRRAATRDLPGLQVERPRAEPLDHAQGVAHEDQRLARTAERVHLGEALVLEGQVPYRQHLVDQEHVGIDVHGHGKAQPGQHAAGVGPHRAVEEVTHSQNASISAMRRRMSPRLNPMNAPSR